MNKAIAAVVAAVLVIAGVSYYFITKCDQPDDLTVQVSTMLCAQSLNQQEILEEACQKLHGQAYPCEFVPEDEEAFMKIIGSKLNDCVDKDMQSQNLCTDKIKRF